MLSGVEKKNYMIWSVSWKNVWRNKTRSLVVIASVMLGIIAGVLIIGIMNGWVEQRMHDAIYNEVSHIQIHNSGYLENEDILNTVACIDETVSVIKSLPEVKAFVKRTKLTAMVSTPWASTGLFLYGINPEEEKQVTQISLEILPGAGAYLDNGTAGTILISDKTAEILKIKNYLVTGNLLESSLKKTLPDNILQKLSSIKDVRFRSPKEFKNALENIFTAKELDKYGRIITDSSLNYRLRSRIQVTFSDTHGNPVQGIFRVCGIYKTSNTGFDQVSAFVNIGELASLCGSPLPPIHEIALMLDDISDAGKVRDKLSGVSQENTVTIWKELVPDAAWMKDFMLMYYFIVIGIIMLALAFGIINTMLMAILERTKELGMLMAIGMNRKRIFSMIMLETLFLTLVGAIAGILAGWGMIQLLGKTGIRFSGWSEGFEAIGYSATVYPFITFDFFLSVIVLVASTAILASLWPARKALKLNPAETLRTE